MSSDKVTEVSATWWAGSVRSHCGSVPVSDTTFKCILEISETSVHAWLFRDGVAWEGCAHEEQLGKAVGDCNTSTFLEPADLSVSAKAQGGRLGRVRSALSEVRESGWDLFSEDNASADSDTEKICVRLQPDNSSTAAALIFADLVGAARDARGARIGLSLGRSGLRIAYASVPLNRCSNATGFLRVASVRLRLGKVRLADLRRERKRVLAQTAALDAAADLVRDRLTEEASDGGARQVYAAALAGALNSCKTRLAAQADRMSDGSH